MSRSTPARSEWNGARAWNAPVPAPGVPVSEHLAACSAVSLSLFQRFDPTFGPSADGTGVT